MGATGFFSNVGNHFFIELHRLYTIDICNLQLVTSATCFGLSWPSLGLQRLVSIKVHKVAVPIGSDRYSNFMYLN